MACKWRVTFACSVHYNWRYILPIQQVHNAVKCNYVKHVQSFFLCQKVFSSSALAFCLDLYTYRKRNMSSSSYHNETRGKNFGFWEICQLKSTQLWTDPKVLWKIWYLVFKFGVKHFFFASLSLNKYFSKRNIIPPLEAVRINVWKSSRQIIFAFAI